MPSPIQRDINLAQDPEARARAKQERHALVIEARRFAVVEALEDLRRRECLEPESAAQMLAALDGDSVPGASVDRFASERDDAVKRLAELQGSRDSLDQAYQELVKRNDELTRLNAEVLRKYEACRASLRANGIVEPA